MRERGVHPLPTLPYGLDVWSHERRVLCVEWTADDARVEVIAYHQGAWEAEIERLVGAGYAC